MPPQELLLTPAHPSVWRHTEQLCPPRGSCITHRDTYMHVRAHAHVHSKGGCYIRHRNLLFPSPPTHPDSWDCSRDHLQLV